MARHQGKRKYKVDKKTLAGLDLTEEGKETLRVRVGEKHTHTKKRVRKKGGGTHGLVADIVYERKAWHGDDDFFVTGVESNYTIWFEFLQLAREQKGVKVDYKHYNDWALGEETIRQTLDNYTANAWTKRIFRRSSRWKELFGINRHDAVTKLKAGELGKETLASIEASGDLLVRVSFTNKGKDDIDRSLRLLLREEMAARGRKSGQTVLRDRAKFQITATNGIDTLTFRRTLEVGKLELKEGGKLRVEEYFDALNKGRKAQKGRKAKRFVELEIASASKIEFDAVRKLIHRDRVRYKKIIANVARGEFPGRYA
jgi:hypothetical protein